MNSDSNKLYRTLWRWHFYAGLFCIPFIISLSVTGAIYLFKPQIDAWVNREFRNLELREKRYSPVEQITAAKKNFPKATFESYRLPENKKQAVVITLRENDRRILVFVNPYTLETLKAVGYNDQFIRIVRTLHGELMLGNTGAVLIELAGGWAMILIITGLYLWWPRSASGAAGVIYPRLAQGSRKFWRDLHAVTGFWVAFFTLFLIVSGLPWALVWGSAFKEIRSMGKQSVVQDWSISQRTDKSDTKVSINFLTNDLLRKATELDFAHPVEFGPDRNTPNTWKLSSKHQNRMLRSDAWFSIDDGQLMKIKTFSDKPTTDQVIGIGIAAHEGHLFGWLNQLIGLLVTLGLITISVSGFVLWRKRKPSDTLGAPPALNNGSGKTILLVTIIFSILLPVVFISLLAIVLLEKFVLKKFKSTSHWLGIAN